MELVGRFCGGRLRFELLSEQNPRMTLLGFEMTKSQEQT